MSSPSLTGLQANNPTKYLGPNVALTISVIRNREPTGADIKQPNTGKYYSFGTIWLVGETSPGVAPTTGTRGDLWYLGYIAGNVAFWFRFTDSIIDNGVETITGDDGVVVLPDVNGNVNILANIVANATNAKPLYVKNTSANSETVELQVASAVAPTPVNLNSCGIACFNNTQFTLDSVSGMVSLITPTVSNFFAYLNADIPNYTGDGTPTTTPIPLNTTAFNVGANFSTGTGLYTAPVAGKYQFNGTICLGNIDAAHTTGRFTIVIRNAATTVLQSVEFGQQSPAACRNISNNFAISGSCIVSMSATDTAELKVLVIGGTKTVSVNGSGIASPPYTCFSGTILP